MAPWPRHPLPRAAQWRARILPRKIPTNVGGGEAQARLPRTIPTRSFRVNASRIPTPLFRHHVELHVPRVGAIHTMWDGSRSARVRRYRCGEHIHVAVTDTKSRLRRSDTSAAHFVDDDDSLGYDTCRLTDVALPRAAELEPGTTVNRYVVLRTLGRGGMGVVYLAFDPELERQVALKLLSTTTGTDTASNNSEARARMLREAQAMAKLSHSNVLPVYDAGSYDGGIFMAVEYIEGGTLREWATRQQRSWREIVNVFLAAGRGLAAAHAAGLIHRDFKPHNVMIGHDGQIRVMDFGLVRSVSEKDKSIQAVPADVDHGLGGLDAELTMSGILMGTPAYMAPEQHVDFTEIDARADQFSFCAALYECLYGPRPFPSRRDEMLRACESGQVATPAADRRVPGWIRKLLLRGLSLRPDDRFASMELLLAALSRDSRKKWQWIAMASGAAAVVLAGGTAWAQWKAEQAQMCSGGPAQMESVWSGELKQHTKAAFSAVGVSYAEDTWMRVEKLVDAYTTAWLGMHRDTCEATRVRKEQSESLMDLRMRCLQRRLWDLDALMKTFSRADAKIVERAVEATDGLTSLTGCADAERLQAQVPPPEDPNVRTRVDESWEQLAEVNALGASGKVQEGLGKIRPILDTAKDLKYGPLEAESWLQLSRLQNDAYDRTAEAAARQAMLAADVSKMDDVRARASVVLVNSIGYIQQRREEGEIWGMHAQAAIDRLGGDPLLEAELLGNLGHAFRIEGDYVRALELGLRSVAVLEKREREDSRLGSALLLIGQASRRLGEYDEAQSYLERSVEVLEGTLGAQHPELANALVELGRNSLRQGEYAKAHVELQRAWAIIEASIGNDNPVGAVLFAQVSLHRGRVFLREGRYGSAEEHLEQALAGFVKFLSNDPNHTQIAFTRIFVGDLYRRQGSYDEARSELEKAVASLEKGTHKLLLAHALLGLGATNLDAGNADTAPQSLERALSLLESLGKNSRPKELAETRFALGRALWESGRDLRRGHDLVSRAREAFAANGKDEHQDLVEADRWLRRHHP